LKAISFFAAEGDLETFSENHKKCNFSSKRNVPENSGGVLKLDLFSKETRPEALQLLYASSCGPVVVPEDWQHFTQDEEENFCLSAVARRLRRRKNLDIEIRRVSFLVMLLRDTAIRYRIILGDECFTSSWGKMALISTSIQA